MDSPLFICFVDKPTLHVTQKAAHNSTRRGQLSQGCISYGSVVFTNCLRTPLTYIRLWTRNQCNIDLSSANVPGPWIIYRYSQVDQWLMTLVLFHSPKYRSISLGKYLNVWVSLNLALTCSFLYFYFSDRARRSYTVPQKPVLVNNTHYLSSSVAETTGYGSTHCPWQLRVRDGQTISVSVDDTLSHSTAGEDLYFTLGTVTEAQKVTKMTVCPEDMNSLKNSRSFAIFTSRTSAIKLAFWSGARLAPYLVEINGTSISLIHWYTQAPTSRNTFL